MEDDVEANNLKRYVVDIQHGTRVEGSLHSSTKGYYSSKGFCDLKANILLLYILYNTVYFPFLQVKNKLREGITNVCLFLGLLRSLRTDMVVRPWY